MASINENGDVIAPGDLKGMADTPCFINAHAHQVGVFSKARRSINVVPFAREAQGGDSVVTRLYGEHYAQFAISDMSPLSPFCMPVATPAPVAEPVESADSNPASSTTGVGREAAAGGGHSGGSGATVVDPETVTEATSEVGSPDSTPTVVDDDQPTPEPAADVAPEADEPAPAVRSGRDIESGDAKVAAPPPPAAKTRVSKATTKTRASRKKRRE